MYERFTDRARKVMQLANQEATRLNQQYIGPEHILLGLLKEGTCVAANLLKNLGVDLHRARRKVEELIQNGRDEITEGRVPPTPRAKAVIECAREEANRLSHYHVGTEHILLGLLREEEDPAAQVLVNLGLSLEQVRQEVLDLFGAGSGAGGEPPSSPEDLATRGPASMSMQHQVVITDFIRDQLEPERKVVEGIAEVTALGARSEEELAGRIERADAIIVYHEISLGRQTIERLGQCRLIVRGGVGIDNIDGEFARQRDIPVANVPDYGSEEVADTALAMALDLTRGTHVMNSRLRAGEGPWSYEQVVPLVRLRGRGFGVIGLGRIGTAAALRAKALGMDVLFYDPYKPDGYDKALGIRRVETLSELLGQSLVVSVHCPLTDETRHMIDAAAIARMPRGAYLINTARGAIVDTRALPDALGSGRLAGVGLDVLETEPPPDDDPLVVTWRDARHPAHHRLIINPHAAFYSVEGLLDIRVKTAEACRRALLGQPLRNVVN